MKVTTHAAPFTTQEMLHSGWEIHALCRCGWHIKLSFGNFAHLHEPCCPACGLMAPHAADFFFSKEWRKVKARWIADAEAWKPWTWFRGHWELMDLNDNQIKP